VQKALSALQREADKIGKAEAIIVTLLPRTVAPLTDEMEIILE